MTSFWYFISVFASKRKSCGRSRLCSIHNFWRWMSRVRVGRLSWGSAQTQFTLFFMKLDQFSSTRHVGGGLKLLPLWCTQPSFVRNGLLLKWLSRSPPLTNGIMKFLPPLLQVGTPFGTSTRRKTKRVFLWSNIHKPIVVNEWRGRVLEKIDKSCPHWARHQWNPWSTCIWVICWPNTFVGMRLTSFGNFFAKRGLFQSCNNVFLVSLLANH